MQRGVQALRYLFDRNEGVSHHLIARWLFLRALGAIYFSAFLALLFQIRGMVGPQGILPADTYLQRIRSLGPLRFWYAPSLLWMGSGNHALMALSWFGLLASLLVVVNVAPRPALFVCFVCFLSFIAISQDFGQYQSDGMLLEAGFLSLFVAPKGLLPGWGRRSLPVRAAMFLLLWEWFRIYFQSGLVKLLSGDPTWRNLTAMYEYYQNGPLPTWIGWYVQHLPHWFQASTVVATLALELVIVWMLFLPRRWRIVCFFIVTPWQIVVILTANYAFLNYIVLALGFLLLDDRFLIRFVPARWRFPVAADNDAATEGESNPESPVEETPAVSPRSRLRRQAHSLGVAATAVMLGWIFYATTVPMLQMFWRTIPLPIEPITALQPFRIANEYGLFAVMTPNRYEIEFQGSDDGHTWVAYPFRYKPQALNQAPGIYAPYQPRFDWNLWFASLGSWTQYPIVPRTEELLLTNDPDVLSLFAANPFPDHSPREVRAVLWQYWFTTMAEKQATGNWWRRQLLGAYAPTLAIGPDGKIGMVREEGPDMMAPPQ